MTPAPRPSLEARNTSRIIDAIESEMSAEFSAPLPPQAGKPTLAQIIEETAILFASGQNAAAHTLLASALAENSGHPQEQLAWWMLFDLYQISGLIQEFETHAIAYAQRYESSPPQWKEKLPPVQAGSKAHALPVLSFNGKLCGNSRPLLERLQLIGCQHAAFCLEFGAISEADLAGCQQLLDMFHHWQTNNHAFMVKEAEGLANQIRSLIEPGRRDANDHAWLLLMELLRLMNHAQAHEETCIAYSITYEVSPPVFTPSANSPAPQPPAGSGFTMPPVVTAPPDALLRAIRKATQTQSVIVIDCAQLICIDFAAAAPLVAGLLQLADGKAVELRHSNHLVSVLLQLVGGKDALTISTRKF
jgi:ABC-type transporter Mla MlaB component